MALNRNKSRRRKLTAVGAIGALAATGFFLYSVFAVQGQGALAQAPLNVQVQPPPAFIMAMDDSGSMLWETLNNTRDGVFVWNDSARSFYLNGQPRGYDDGASQRYYYTFPPYGRGNEAIPPIDAFGFARSPDVNPGYFDPRVNYPAWKNADGSDFLVVDEKSAPLDPRPAGSPSKINGAVNLTENIEATANNWRFRVRNGMTLPKGTVVQGSGPDGPCRAETGNINEPHFRDLPQDRTLTQNCHLHFSFFPATFFLEDPATLPAEYGYTATPVAVTDALGGRPGTLYKYEIRSGNFGTTAQYEQAIQNFANWFSFYRVRREALIGGSTNALVNANNMRVGWFRIHNRNNVKMWDMGDLTEKQSLIHEIRTQMRASGSTPTRQAVRHLGEQFKRPGEDAPVQLKCQKNAGMLFTDGYINESSNPSPGNLDQAYGPPFSDNVSNTMADIVIPYYYESLRPDIEENAVRVPPACSAVPTPPGHPDPEHRHLDCQTNLHMNFYGVTLGTMGEEFGVNYLPDPVQPWRISPDPYLNPPPWKPRQDLHPRAVDEMWHATLNARGEMINARSPAEITSAMRRVLDSITAGSSPAGSIALTGSRIGTGSLSVEPFYAVENEGTDWYSYLNAFTVTANPLTRQVTFTQAWEASDKIPAHGSRNIMFGRGNDIRPFTTVDVDGFDMLCDSELPGMSRCDENEFGSGPGQVNVSIGEAIAYLRGDVSLEVRNGGVLRDRTSRLGNIVNSTPVISAPRDDYGYRSLSGLTDAETLASTYALYLDDKRQNRNVMVYAGANDGMLHAFDGGMGDDGVMNAAAGGTERFGFIPQSVLGYMGNLLFPYQEADGGDQKFQHRYFVDGPITVSDAHYGGNWATVLVGTTGAGGRGVFALDVSDASRSSGGNLSDGDFLWEINNVNPDLPLAVRNNIGNVLGRPVIVPVRSGSTVSWKAIFGNGYNSATGNAVLFVVDIDDGTPTTRMIEAEESGAPAGRNGLGNIVVLDRFSGPDQDEPGRDGFADTVYAADQKGAIWRFDLGDPSNKVTTPVFVTQDSSDDDEYRQPILGGLTAAAGPAGGVMLYFGTGSFAFVNDPRDESVQSLYGVLDYGHSGTLTTTNLLQQTVVSTDPVAGVREVSANAMAAGKMGWYLDLPKGERFVGYPRVESGIIFMPTYAPTELDGCSTAGFNWLFGLNALSGAASLSNVSVGSPTGDSPGAGTGAVALDTGGTAPVRDVEVLTAPRVGTLAAGSDPDDLEDALAAQCSMVIQVAGAPPLYLPRACGRQSWRQLL